MGTPLIAKQSDATAKQYAFINYGMVEFVEEERNFQILLHGGKPSETSRPGTVQDVSKKKLKDPRKLKMKT